MTPLGAKTLDQIFAVREDWLATTISEKLSMDEREELSRGLVLIEKLVGMD